MRGAEPDARLEGWTVVVLGLAALLGYGAARG
jgi:hypothetical protein